MKTTQISASVRTELGKRGTKDLRNADMVPAVIYHEGKATHIYINYLDARSILYTAEAFIVNIGMEDGSVIDAIVTESQYHNVTDKIQHIDFVRVLADKALDVNLPLELVGVPVGVTKGGKLLTKLRRIKVRGIPSALPDNVKVNVAALELGATIKVSDVKFENITIITPSSAAIASVEIPRSLRSSKSADVAKK